MNFGTQQIQNIIFNQAKKAGLRGYPLGKFAKDTAKLIVDLFEEEESANRQWNIAHDFPEHLEKIVRRLENGLKFNLFPRTDEAKEVYEWIIEQEEQGYALERFIAWATKPERIQYAGKYRSKPMYLKADYPQAFIGISEEKTIVRNEDGSLYV